MVLVLGLPVSQFFIRTVLLLLLPLMAYLLLLRNPRNNSDWARLLLLFKLNKNACCGTTWGS